MPQNKLAELRALHAAMTPGEWFYRENSVGGQGIDGKGNRVYSVEICGDGRGADCRPWFEGCGFKRWSSRVICVIQDWAHWTDHPANRDGVIATHNAFPAMADVIEAAQSYVDAMEQSRTIESGMMAMERYDALAKALEKFGRQG